MKNLTRIALAFTAVAAVTATAVAHERWGRDGGMGGGMGPGMGSRAMMHFERADADDSGDVTFEEFAAAFGAFQSVDADGDGSLTVEEIAAEIERRRTERMARRMIERFDTDGDGVLTEAEIESRQQKMFALMDRNDDGKVDADEMPRRHRGGGMGMGPRH
ncbi:EF-hand domain-containing protein [Aquibium sp. A9E412]|uniref:EF-hand domain-containing protein n=1 Tax=Aquibium sp. A9E412 TaxID=2976767 RepID=UPI0025B08613|nr:EF-hand domain-containing protein [Aquibium sp. A9E412]MDN2567720.1 EF-hand domain-containing protein [Aquibium sp. A9E412]